MKNNAIKTNKEFSDKVNRYMANDGGYAGEAEVYHYLEMLRDLVGFDKVKEAVVNNLKGKKIAAYYGCLLLRPGKVMRMDDPENPTIIEDLIRALGAEAVIYARRNECCGAYVSVESPESAKRNASAIVENAKAAGLTELYLYTHHLGLYEKFGWEFVEEVKTFKEESPIERLYKLTID